MLRRLRHDAGPSRRRAYAAKCALGERPAAGAATVHIAGVHAWLLAEQEGVLLAQSHYSTTCSTAVAARRQSAGQHRDWTVTATSRTRSRGKVDSVTDRRPTDGWRTGWRRLDWLNPPPQVARDQDDLLVTAAEGSDLWRTTSYGFIHDAGHALLTDFPDGTAAEVGFIADFSAQFSSVWIIGSRA